MSETDGSPPDDRKASPPQRSSDALLVKRTLVAPLYLIPFAASLPVAVMAISSIIRGKDVGPSVTVLAFTILQIAIPVYAVRRVRRSEKVMVLLGTGLLVMLLWLLSIGACGIATSRVSAAGHSGP